MAYGQLKVQMGIKKEQKHTNITTARQNTASKLKYQTQVRT